MNVSSLNSDGAHKGVKITPYMLIHVEKEIIKLKRHVIIEKSKDSNNYFERKKKGFLNSLLLHDKIYLTEEYYNKCYLVNGDKDFRFRENEVDLILDGFVAVVNRENKVDSYSMLALKRKLF